MSTNTTRTRIDVYRRVTDHIIADLEQGVRSWLLAVATVTESGETKLSINFRGPA